LSVGDEEDIEIFERGVDETNAGRLDDGVF
jgi:hypothetical protein